MRVDGPADVLPLGWSEGEAELRQRVALTVRRLMQHADLALPPPTLAEPLFSDSFVVTNGLAIWTVVLVSVGPGRKPLLMFKGEIPPRDRDLWIVRQTIAPVVLHEARVVPKGVICFTPGTLIRTPQGDVDVADLREGDTVQTADNGPAEILWTGRRDLSGARLRAMPHLRPVRVLPGALGAKDGEAPLRVSPDHHVLLRGARARDLFNTDEVLVRARDLIDDVLVLRDDDAPEVSYIHLMLPRHEIIFANGVATDSFHPARAAMGALDAAQQARLHAQIPELAQDPAAYGPTARRVLHGSELAILRHAA